MSLQFTLAIDQGTTSTRAVIFDRELNSIAMAQQELIQHYPSDGWVEHCAKEIWQSTLATCREVLRQAQLSGTDIGAIGITNQRETTVLWHRETGEPLHHAIVWQDRRTHDSCKILKAQGHENIVQMKTGLILDAYFSATKLQWLLDNIPNARQLAEQGKLAFGTIDTWLLWKLTEGKSHKTDATNASRTLLFNIHTQSWDDDLLTLFNIPSSLLPKVCDSSDNFGVTKHQLFDAEIPIQAMIGDQQAALVGQQCFSNGDAKCTYGTGAFLMVNTGEQAVLSQHRLLTTIAYRVNNKTTYAIEGSIFIAGAVIQWLRDGLHLFDHAEDSQKLAQSLNALSPITFVPAFTGLGAPYWDPEARGAIFGLTRDTGIQEITTAALQSVALQTYDLIQAMENDGIELSTLKVDGGMTQNTWLMQLLADIIDREIYVPKQGELSVSGAALLASMPEQLSDSMSAATASSQYLPNIDTAKRRQVLQNWKKAIQATKQFSQNS